MSGSQVVNEAIERYGIPDETLMSPAVVNPCQGAKFHSPRPLVTQVYVEDPDLDLECAIWLCPTCYENLRVLLHLAGSSSDPLEWTILREFGNQLRALGLKIITLRKDHPHG